MLSLVDSMLTDNSFEILINSIPDSLVLLDLSRNENLTQKSYEKLHRLKNLKYLNVEQNQMGDECLAALLQIKQDVNWNVVTLIDGTKVNQAAIIDLFGETPPNQKLSPNKIISLYENVKDKFKLVGLVTSLKSLNISKNKISLIF